jgi:hypothetical protein
MSDSGKMYYGTYIFRKRSEKSPFPWKRLLNLTPQVFQDLFQNPFVRVSQDDAVMA